MANIVFVSLYDEFCGGMRMLVAGLKRAGHQSSLIAYKQNSRILLPDAHEVWDECHIQVFPQGDHVNAYAYPATEKEEELFCELINKLDPDMVGIGFTVVQQRTAKRLAELVKKHCGKEILFGGPFVTADQEWGLKNGADYVISGECDTVILDIAEAIDKKEDIRGIDNLRYLDDNGKTKFNMLRPLITDLDSLPFPDFSDDNYYIDHDEVSQGMWFKESDLNHSYITVTTRGCAYHCSFCIHSVTQGLYSGAPKVRERSIDNVLEELKQHREWRGKSFYVEVLDAIININPKRIKEFCEKYHQEINLPFWGYTHPSVVREATIKPLAECPNFEYTIMGIQSASEEIGTDLFKRPHSRETVINAAKLITDSGIRLFCDMITNVPGETEEMCRENLDLLRDLPKPWRLRLSKLSLFPEYEVRKTSGAVKAVSSKRYDLWNALYFLASEIDMSDEEVDKFLANEWFNEDPSILYKFSDGFEQRYRRADDLRAYLQVERANHAATKEELAEARAELADIKYRKGFRHFYNLSNMIQGGSSNGSNGNGNGHHGNGHNGNGRAKKQPAQEMLQRPARKD